MNKANMLKMKPKVTGVSFQSPVKCGGSPGGSEAAAGIEVRPCGMYVQKRTKDTKPCSVPDINVKVKYGSYFHQVTLSSQASFGELKKMLAGKIGLNPQDQKLMFKEKERDSKAFLDIVGVKDGSKIVLIEDELSKERRILESRCMNIAKMETASKDIAAIRLEVDKLAKQVASIESTINSGKKVEELVLLNLTESLMIQLIKLDGISADGEIKLQRRMQVKMAQKYIEILDSLKPRNSHDILIKPRQENNLHEQSKPGNFAPMERVVITTKWETF